MEALLQGQLQGLGLRWLQALNVFVIFRKTLEESELSILKVSLRETPPPPPSSRSDIWVGQCMSTVQVGDKTKEVGSVTCRRRHNRGTSRRQLLEEATPSKSPRSSKRPWPMTRPSLMLQDIFFDKRANRGYDRVCSKGFQCLSASMPSRSRYSRQKQPKKVATHRLDRLRSATNPVTDASFVKMAP